VTSLSGVEKWKGLYKNIRECNIEVFTQKPRIVEQSSMGIKGTKEKLVEVNKK